MIGATFGMLTVVSRSPSLTSSPVYECLCTCGVRVSYRGSYLTNRNVRSCGCIGRSRYLEHWCLEPGCISRAFARSRCRRHYFAAWSKGEHTKLPRTYTTYERVREL